MCSFASGKNNPSKLYKINSHTIKPVEYHNDLGVIITKDLSWSRHISYTVSKANKIKYILFKSFCRLSEKMYLKLYKSYIRPILEYANLVWTPVLKQDTELIEKVQRRSTKYIYKYRNLNYGTRLQKLHLSTLEKRRDRGDLIWTYKIFNDPRYCQLKDLFQININRLRGHKFKVKCER